MSIPRQEHAAVLLDNNRVLVVGGYSAASAELYNPATNSWSPAGAMQDARIYHAVVKLSNGKVLAVGGADEFGDPLASADLYNPATNRWSPTGALGVARGSLTLTLLNNGKVLASGGKLNVVYLTSTELYDPATATWTPTDSLATGRGGHTATMLANGSVLVVGGYNGDILDSVELFAPDTGTWSTIGSLATPRIGHTASLLADSVVIAGGYGPVGYIHAALSSTERLDVAYSLTVSASGPGTVAGAPASGSYPLGTVVQLTATSNPGSTFLGWTVDNLFRGWGSLLTFTMNGPHTVAAVFAGVPTFPDVSAADPANTAIGSLASRGIIKGYQDGTFGPNNSTQRSQMAALIARAMGWEQEDWGNPFVDGNGLDANLWRNVGTLAHYQVAFGYDPTHFAPTDAVTRAQTISFITRAMVAKGYWTQQADNPALFANVPASSGHRQDLATYVYYAGALPDPQSPAGQRDPRLVLA